MKCGGLVGICMCHALRREDCRLILELHQYINGMCKHDVHKLRRNVHVAVEVMGIGEISRVHKKRLHNYS